MDIDDDTNLTTDNNNTNDDNVPENCKTAANADETKEASTKAENAPKPTIKAKIDLPAKPPKPTKKGKAKATKSLLNLDGQSDGQPLNSKKPSKTKKATVAQRMEPHTKSLLIDAEKGQYPRQNGIYYRLRIPASRF